MAQKLSKSQLLAKQKSLTKGAWKKSRKSEARAKGQQLPDGLIKAIAKVIDSGFAATKEKGIPYYFIKGKVIEPAEYGGTKFMKMWFLKATAQKSIEQKMEELASDLKLLVGEEREAEIDELDESGLPDFIEGLKNLDLYFEFNTWKPAPTKQSPNPSTFVFIQGTAEAPEEPEEDENEGEEPEEENDEGEEEKPVRTSKKPSKQAKDEDDDDTPSDDSENDEGDGGEDESEDDGAGEEETEGEDWEPKAKEVYYYKHGPKGKPKEVAVVTVDKKKKTVKVKRLEDDKIFPVIPWDSLTGEE